MSFWKKDPEFPDRLIKAESRVHTPTDLLDKADKDSYTYPVDGWYWFDTREEAEAAILGDLREVSRFQAKAAMAQEGVLAAVETYMSTATEIEQIAWAEAAVFKRNSPMLQAVATSLGWSDAFVDNLFDIAETITA